MSFWFEKKILTESVNKNDVIKALKGRNRVKISYSSEVPNYGKAEGDRYAVVLALGKGRFPHENPDDVIRIYQWEGDSYGNKRNKSYKILYLKDILDFEILPVREKDPGPLFNPLGDKWMSSVEMVANFNKYGYTKDRVNTKQDYDKYKAQTSDKEKELINLENKFRIAKGYTNRALTLYNKARKSGNQEDINKALETFRQSQALTNKIMASYKAKQKEKNNPVVQASKSETEKAIEK
jgi:hypothetical protein